MLKLEGESIKDKLTILESFKDTRRKQLIESFKVQFVYGHREILLKYSGIDETALLTGILQHGVGPTFTLNSDWPTPRVNLLKRSPLWVYSRVAAKELSSEGVRNVKAIGSPWLYSKILDSFEVLDSPSKHKYLVFPEHFPTSANHNSTEVTRTKIRTWKSIAGQADLEICLFWSEFTDPIWKRVAHQEEVSLKCAGYPNSPRADIQIWSNSDERIDYYKNLRNMISSATHCIFEAFTSAIFYASDLGKDIGFFPETSRIKVEPIYRTGHNRELLWLEYNVPEIFRNFERNGKLSEITKELLGYDDLLSPRELTEVLSFRGGVFSDLAL